jgi:hypothetical protein
MTAPPADHRTGAAALAGGLLMAGAVGAELLHPVQEADGSVVSPDLFAGYLAVWTLGAAALLVAQLGLRHGAVGRIGRIGGGLSVAGTGLLLAFGIVVVVSALATGAPLEASFLAFALGLLLVAVGWVLLGLGLRRSGAVGRWWAALPVAALGALVALLAESAHDAGLFLLFGAWGVLGVGGMLHRRRPADRIPARVG